MDKETGATVVPPQSDTTAPNDYVWDDPRLAGSGAPSGTGSNWSFESARLPGVEPARQAPSPRSPQLTPSCSTTTSMRTHRDLGIKVVELCRLVVVACTAGADGEAHGTHVAGTIGARWDNPGNIPESNLGVSGGNPASPGHLFGVAYHGNFLYAAQRSRQQQRTGSARPRRRTTRCGRRCWRRSAPTARGRTCA